MLNVQLENVVVSTDGVVNQRNSYCLPSKGCQSEFSECSKENTSTTTTTKITTTKTTTTKISSTSTVVGKCGKEYGKCPSGQCCSKYGWCGKSDDYCDTSKGCQSAFGTCTNKFEGKYVVKDMVNVHLDNVVVNMDVVVHLQTTVNPIVKVNMENVNEIK